MAESYTTPHSLPVLGTADYVRSPTGDNIRKQINALAATTNLAITNEGVRAEGAAKTYADTKDTANRTAWAAADAVLAAKQAVKAVKLEAGKWVWDLAGATHYVIPDHTGSLIVRATAQPVPAATPALDW